MYMRVHTTYVRRYVLTYVCTYATYMKVYRGEKNIRASLGAKSSSAISGEIILYLLLLLVLSLCL